MEVLHGNWPHVPLGKVFKTTSGGTPLSSREEYYEGGTIPWINSGELGVPFIGKAEHYLTIEGLQSSSAKMLPVDSVLIAMYGATAGKASLLKMPACVNQAICAVLPNKTYSSLFLKYYIDTIYYYLVSLSSGSARSNLSQEVIRNIKIPFPDLPTQLRIAGVLGSIDEKIELNRKKIAELEALAKIIYDYWFVQFDFPDKNGKPYKSSGGKMVWNDLLKREVPEGWEVGNLYTIADFENGLACQRFRPKGDEASLPVIKIREMHDGINHDTERVSANIPAKHRIADGDLLFSWSASLEAMIWCGGTGGLNQHIFKVTPRGEYSVEYVYRQLASYIVTFAKMAEARKTTMGHITADHIKQSRIILPSDEILSRFATGIKPIFDRRIFLRREIRVLEEQRDTLLPLLMNGQVEVRGEK